MLIRYLIVLFILFSGEAVAQNSNRDNPYFNLRNQILTVTSKQLGMKTPVLAVLMETRYPEAVFTLAAVADGSASIYFSNGGGIIGAGKSQQVNNESIAMVNIAKGYIKKMSRVEDYPLPKTDHVRFYIITDSGVYSEEVPEDELGNKKHILSPIFYQGHKLITEIRVADEHRRKNHGK